MKPKRNALLKRVRFILNARKIDLPAISNLMASVGMRGRKSANMRRAILASSDVITAYVGEELVGFGRMISDRTYYGTIWDVAVKPDLQARRIGTRIMKTLLRRARKRKLYMIGLFTGGHNRTFYERLGFLFLTDVHAMTTSVRVQRRRSNDKKRDIQ